MKNKNSYTPPRVEDEFVVFPTPVLTTSPEAATDSVGSDEECLLDF